MRTREPDLPTHADVVVIGGGIVGQASAASIAGRGAAVVLLEKEARPAREASGLAQGSLRLQGRDPAEFPLAKEAMKLWADADTQAGDEDDFELAFGGNVYICEDEGELSLLRRLVREAHTCGLDAVRLLSADEARAMLPALIGPFTAAMYSPVDGACQPSKATEYFARAAVRAGASAHYGVKAVGIQQRHGQVVAVVTERGRIQTRSVVVAGGVWTPLLTETVGVHVPIMPVSLTGAETTPAAPMFAVTIRAPRFGARPRPDGRIVFSAGLNTTVDHAISLYDLRDLRLWAPRLFRHWRSVRLSFDIGQIARQVRAGSPRSPRLIGQARPRQPNRVAMERAFSAMLELIPGLADTRIARMWAGVVDMSPDGRPIIDHSAGPTGLVIITGLSGHGLALGPVLGEIAADLALTGATHRSIEPFRLSRFREAPVDIPEKMI